MDSLGLQALALHDRYRTGGDDLVASFYAPCLRAATHYDRAVGYFRSTVFLVVGPALVDFVGRGGRIRLVCSPDLTDADAKALTEGYEARQVAAERALLREVEWLLAQREYLAQTVALATLVRLGTLDVRLAFPRAGAGMYHEKLGLFTDPYGNEVTFKGSSNETLRAWHAGGNVESFDVFRSWIPEDERRVTGHRHDFEELWEGDAAGAETLPFPHVAKDRLCSVAVDRLEDLAFSLAKAQATKAPLPARRQPLPHQVEALEAWRARHRRGILEHATGSGKTFTSLLAIDEHVSGGGVALVLVPSELLLEQWSHEVALTISGDVTVLRAGAGNDLWRRRGRLEAFTSANDGLGPRVLIATLQTACRPSFYERVQGGPHLLLVVDEVHKAGSPEHRRAFGIEAGARLGLSATPRRYGDPDGTEAILSYFGGVVPPPFTLRDALTSTPPRLVPYDYVPHAVSLAPHEAEAYAELTEEVRKEYARQPRDGEGAPLRLSGRLKHLLIRRARIVKKAQGKVALAAEVLSAFDPGDYWLVYCEDVEQLDAVFNRVRERGLPAQAYHSRMQADAEGTLQWFREYGGVLVSIRCLDEGVDIPQTSHALILASSQNPREFIQRRGRVLRIAPERYDKRYAVVHDALVVPDELKGEPAGTSIARSELARALEFASTARNASVAEATLLEVALDMGLNLADYLDEGLESDEDEETEHVTS